VNQTSKAEAAWSRSDVKLPNALRAERRGDVALLWLTRPEKRNAINSDMLYGIKLFFNSLHADVKATVVAAEGNNFSAGLDLTELAEKDAAEGAMHSREWHDAFREVQYSPVPVICVLHGAVVGAGLELASATHIRVAEPSAYYGLPEGQRGIFLGGGGSMRLTRLIGVSRVTDLMLTGRTLNAQDGYMFGFSQYLVEAGKGLEKGLEIAHRTATNAPLSNYAIIQALPRIAEMGPDEGLFMEAMMTGVVQSSKDAKQRLGAFLEKRADKVKRPD
jgi:enoyl-CoA hydratase/carnithine racemase